MTSNCAGVTWLTGVLVLSPLPCSLTRPFATWTDHSDWARNGGVIKSMRNIGKVLRERRREWQKELIGVYVTVPPLPRCLMLRRCVILGCMAVRFAAAGGVSMVAHSAVDGVEVLAGTVVDGMGHLTGTHSSKTSAAAYTRPVASNPEHSDTSNSTQSDGSLQSGVSPKQEVSLVPSKPQARPKPTDVCYYCNGKGHWKIQDGKPSCPKLIERLALHPEELEELEESIREWQQTFGLRKVKKEPSKDLECEEEWTQKEEERQRVVCYSRSLYELTDAFENRDNEYIGQLKSMYGPQVGMYFAFLNSYTNSTMGLALLAVAVMICSFYMNWLAYMRLLGLFGFFTASVWGPFTMIRWQRRSNELVQKWGMKMVETDSDISPLYNAKADADNDNMDPLTFRRKFGYSGPRQGKPEEWERKKKRNSSCPGRTQRILSRSCRKSVMIVVIALVCLLVLVLNFALITFQSHVQRAPLCDSFMAVQRANVRGETWPTCLQAVGTGALVVPLKVWYVLAGFSLGACTPLCRAMDRPWPDTASDGSSDGSVDRRCIHGDLPLPRPLLYF